MRPLPEICSPDRSDVDGGLDGRTSPSRNTFPRSTKRFSYEIDRNVETKLPRDRNFDSNANYYRRAPRARSLQQEKAQRSEGAAEESRARRGFILVADCRAARKAAWPSATRARAPKIAQPAEQRRSSSAATSIASSAEVDSASLGRGQGKHGRGAQKVHRLRRDRAQQGGDGLGMRTPGAKRGSRRRRRREAASRSRAVRATVSRRGTPSSDAVARPEFRLRRWRSARAQRRLDGGGAARTKRDAGRRRRPR